MAISTLCTYFFGGETGGRRQKDKRIIIFLAFCSAAKFSNFFFLRSFACIVVILYEFCNIRHVWFYPFFLDFSWGFFFLGRRQHKLRKYSFTVWEQVVWRNVYRRMKLLNRIRIAIANSFFFSTSVIPKMENSGGFLIFLNFLSLFIFRTHQITGSRIVSFCRYLKIGDRNLNTSHQKINIKFCFQISWNLNCKIVDCGTGKFVRTPYLA